MNITLELTNSPKVKPNFSNGVVPFGKVITDHMFLMDYTEGRGWENPRIVPHGPLQFDPSCVSFHYAQTIFEGLKAYKTSDGQVTLFRPNENAARFNNSAHRMYMPQLPEEYFVQSVKKVVEVDKSWIPSALGTSLYIRPFMMATEATLNLTYPQNFMFCILLCPVGHLSGAFKPVRMLVEEHFVRAAPGGTGFAKCGGNYAGAMRASFEVKDKGYDQALWLDAVDRKYIEEASAMNIFFMIDEKVITPETGDTVLSGITRKSVIQLIKDMGITVEERKIDIQEIVDAYSNGKLKEVFSAGTAAVITPVGEINYKGNQMIFSNGKVGELSQKLYDTLTGIQTGVIQDKHGWVVKVGQPH